MILNFFTLPSFWNGGNKIWSSNEIQDGEANQRTLTTGLSSLNCDIVVTIEPPQPQPQTDPELEPEPIPEPELDPEEVVSACCNEVNNFTNRFL